MNQNRPLEPQRSPNHKPITHRNKRRQSKQRRNNLPISFPQRPQHDQAREYVADAFDPHEGEGGGVGGGDAEAGGGADGVEDEV